MALTIIVVLYLSIGLMSAAGSIYLSQKFLPTRWEAPFFALFLIPIAGFYLAFTAYFGDAAAWHLEGVAVAVFAVLGLLGARLPVFLILGYLLHGTWDLLHELHVHLGADTFGGRPSTQIPLVYGAFCATYDVVMAAYFYNRRPVWAAARLAAPR
ncbi:MAG TPA: hypothetical protein VJM11_14955 [Nevskiaceae bacterium]|nr:hypothetical protein [Nevskiaceae bacterium]